MSSSWMLTIKGKFDGNAIKDIKTMFFKHCGLVFVVLASDPKATLSPDIVIITQIEQPFKAQIALQSLFASNAHFENMIASANIHQISSTYKLL